MGNFSGRNGRIKFNGSMRCWRSQSREKINNTEKKAEHVTEKWKISGVFALAKVCQSKASI